MKATDLMIGDWIQIADLDYNSMRGEYHQIDWLRTGELGLDNRKIITPPYAEPIPLTKEFLERNGFDQNGIGSDELELIDADYSDDTYVWQERDEYDNLFTISIYDLNCGSWQMEIVDSPKGKMDIEIKFVHQLQHTLRLCGIDKEIVL